MTRSTNPVIIIIIIIIKQDGIDAVNWGWSMQNDQLIQIMSQMTAASDGLLKVFHSNCSSACRTFCCSCRRHGLPCLLYALLRADFASLRTVTVCTTDFFQTNRKMKTISNWMFYYVATLL